MEMRRLAACISIFCLMFSSVASAQQIATPEWARSLGGGWIISLLVAFILIVAAVLLKKEKYSKYILGLGVIALFAGIVLIEIGVLLPLFSHPTVSYEQCTGMFRPDVSVVSVPGLLYATSCILTGYSPSNLEWLTITTFFIFGIIAPFALLVSLFYDFIPEGMITHSGARNVIAFAGALLAFRGFFATFFIDLLSYGFVGIGALLIGVLFAGYVWKAAYRFINPLGIDVEKQIQTILIGEAARLLSEIEDLDRQLNSGGLSPDQRKRIAQIRNYKWERLQELQKTGGKK